MNNYSISDQRLRALIWWANTCTEAYLLRYPRTIGVDMGPYAPKVNFDIGASIAVNNGIVFA